ncbi:unnamed protein product [Enterobius vermicularis]|uniref:AAA_12 domain-containing protein n=1 Tax=Enterobius vermicularis TaxID=51028 RepID=A0A0N4VIB9_ENTVE|nr:unnamed protein product [Enterobius vermicularis]
MIPPPFPPSNRQAELEFTIPYKEGTIQENTFSKRVKFWVLETELRIETPHHSMRSNRSGMATTILEVHIQPNDIIVKTWMNNDQVGLALHYIPKLFLENQSEALKCLLGLSHNHKGIQLAEQQPKFISDMTAQRCRSLNQPHRELARTILVKNDPIVFSQAPAGTGKTFTVAICLCELMAQEGIVLLAAPNNLAIQSIAQKVLKLEPTIPIGNLLFLQAPLSEKIYSGSVEDLWTRYRISETLHHMQMIGVAEAYTEFAIEYTGRRLKHDGQSYKEGEARQLLYSIIDEGGSVRESTFSSMVSMLPNFEKIFITGDKFQLSPYTRNLPKQIIPYGRRWAIHQLTMNDQITQIALKENYQSHPQLVEDISKAAYKGQLIPKLNLDQRAMWRNLEFPVMGQEQRSFTKSLINQDYNQVALQIWRYIITKLPAAIIAILFYYEASVAYLKNCNPFLPVYTVNQFQGQEADMVILITIRTGIAENVSPFLFGFQRTTVALSRARESLSIIAGHYHQGLAISDIKASIEGFVETSTRFSLSAILDFGYLRRKRLHVPKASAPILSNCLWFYKLLPCRYSVFSLSIGSFCVQILLFLFKLCFILFQIFCQQNLDYRSLAKRSKDLTYNIKCREISTSETEELEKKF